MRLDSTKRTRENTPEIAERVSVPGKEKEGGRCERVRERREVVAGRVSLHLLSARLSGETGYGRG